MFQLLVTIWACDGLDLRDSRIWWLMWSTYHQYSWWNSDCRDCRCLVHEVKLFCGPGTVPLSNQNSFFQLIRSRLISALHTNWHSYNWSPLMSVVNSWLAESLVLSWSGSAKLGYGCLLPVDSCIDQSTFAMTQESDIAMQLVWPSNECFGGLVVLLSWVLS